MKESFFRFKEPHLIDLEYHENPDFDEAQFGEMQIQCETNVQNIQDENEAFVSLKMQIGNTETCPFMVAIEMGAFFSWEECEDTEMIESLLTGNAPSLLLGYIRPIVATITSSSRFPTLNIPFMDLRKPD